MRASWFRKTIVRERWLEDALRRERPAAGDDLVRSVVARVDAAGAGRRRPALRPRLGFAVALSALMLVGMSAVGGIGYAANSVHAVAKAAKKAVTPAAAAAPEPEAVQELTANVTSASSPSAAGKVAICHATGSSTNPYVTITVSANGLDGHGGHAEDIYPAPAAGCPAAGSPSPSEDQYRPGKGCGDKNHVHFREGECKKLAR